MPTLIDAFAQGAGESAGSRMLGFSATVGTAVVASTLLLASVGGLSRRAISDDDTAPKALFGTLVCVIGVSILGAAWFDGRRDYKSTVVSTRLQCCWGCSSCLHGCVLACNGLLSIVLSVVFFGNFVRRKDVDLVLVFSLVLGFFALAAILFGLRLLVRYRYVYKGCSLIDMGPTGLMRPTSSESVVLCAEEGECGESGVWERSVALSESGVSLRVKVEGEEWYRMVLVDNKSRVVMVGVEHEGKGEAEKITELTATGEEWIGGVGGVAKPQLDQVRKKVWEELGRGTKKKSEAIPILRTFAYIKDGFPKREAAAKIATRLVGNIADDHQMIGALLAEKIALLAAAAGAVKVDGAVPDGHVKFYT